LEKRLLGKKKTTQVGLWRGKTGSRNQVTGKGKGAERCRQHGGHFIDPPVKSKPPFDATVYTRQEEAKEKGTTGRGETYFQSYVARRRRGHGDKKMRGGIGENPAVMGRNS